MPTRSRPRRDVRESSVALARLVVAAVALLGAEDARRSCAAADPPASTARGDRLVADYFRAETARIAERSLASVKTGEDWNAQKGERRQALFRMLGLDPLPERTPLAPVVVKKLDFDDYSVENLHFQSRPGLYVTANLYLPRSANKASGKPRQHPAILYVCGHARVRKDDRSLGNKTAYQHHGIWFARHGYVCLTIDTLQLGEIPGIHHGTHNLERWWWNAAGYTPAGVEAWNSIRAVDYLVSRPEVDPERIGATGRSGGGAYTCWVAALDDRVKVAVPVAGITSLANHVVDGCVAGHCDCMYPLNAARWDFAEVTALVAPRPLLILNTDMDRIFPEDGVRLVAAGTRRIYGLLGAEDRFGVEITPGPHLDTPALQELAFKWFEKHLKQAAVPAQDFATSKPIPPETLAVFDTLPADETNTRIDESFVAAAPVPPVPADKDAWTKSRDERLRFLRRDVFGGWPDAPSATGEIPAIPVPEAKPVFAAVHDGVACSAWDFDSQAHVPLRLFVLHRAGLAPKDLDLVVLNVLDEQGWPKLLRTLRVGFEKHLGDIGPLPEADADAFAQEKKMFAAFKWGMAYVAPRGIGPTAWTAEAKARHHVERRFVLLGQTSDGMRVWDVRQAIRVLRAREGFAAVPLWLQGERRAAGWALYASLFEPDVKRLDLWHLAKSHRDGAIFLNVLRGLDVPQAVALAAERSQVRIYQSDAEGWSHPLATAEALGWGEKRVQVRRLPGTAP